jgi:hypothetical protein
MWLIYGLWFLRVNWFLYLTSLHLRCNKLVWFHLVNIYQLELGPKLVNVTNKIILLANMYCTLYGPKHFLMNFPKCDLLPFRNHITRSPNLNCFFIYFYWFYKALFHCWIPNLTLDYSLSSYSSSNSNTLNVKTLVRFPSLWLLPMTNIIYYVGIKGCNQQTSLYGVYFVATLYVIL